MGIKRIKQFSIIVIALGLVIMAGGCERRAEQPSTGKITVITTLFPLFDFAKNVGGDKARVSMLIPPGIEVHSFEPKPGDVMKVKEADLFVYTGDAMEPWVQRFLTGVRSERLRVVDASEGITLMKIKEDHHEKEARGHAEGHHEGEQSHHHHGNLDPHIWLDFANAQNMVDTIAVGFAAKDPAHKDIYLKNASEYKARLAYLDRTYRETLATCEKRIIIHGGHFAFNYLASRYGLVYESAYSGSPDAEPTAKRLMELRKKLKMHGVDTVFYEELIEPRTADVLAKDTKSKLLKLHGAHNITKDEMNQGVTFIHLMEQNLTSLRAGLKCKGE